jgi:hypothetical protein
MASIHFWRRFRGWTEARLSPLDRTGHNGYWIMMETTTRNKSYHSKNNCQIIMCRSAATTYLPPIQLRFDPVHITFFLPQIQSRIIRETTEILTH